MVLRLTKDQEEKLLKLEEEMRIKAEYEEKHAQRKKDSSHETGIPVNIIDMDVIKIGTMLGLIRKKSVLEGKEKGEAPFSILDMFSDAPKKPIDVSKIPKPFKNALSKTLEISKIQYHQEYVSHQCFKFSKMVEKMIDDELSLLNKHISINLEKRDMNDFKNVCSETLEVMIENLMEEDCHDDWEAVKVLRNSLLGVLNVCEYKQILHDNINILRKKYSKERIVDYLSINDARLSMYADSLEKEFDKDDLRSNVSRVYREMVIRSYTKPPELKPFDFDYVLNQCCNPSLLYLPVTDVLEFGILNPYRNNSIGFLNLQPENVPWACYILKTVDEEGLRMWMLDNSALQFSKNLSFHLLTYLKKIFVVFRAKTVRSSVAIEKDFWKNHLHADVFENLLRNILFVSNQIRFHSFLVNLLKTRSPLIPTEYDFFNHMTFYEQPNDMKIDLSHTSVAELFPEMSRSDLNEMVANLR